MTDTAELERCLAEGGVALFPSDTVYGLACDPENPAAVQRLYGLKGRPLGKPSAVMFFDLDAAFEFLPDLGPRIREVMCRLLPGGVTMLIENTAHRFPLACGDTPDVMGVRVPAVEQLQGMRHPVLQSSANLAGGPDPRRVGDVPGEIRTGVDLVIDGGELPGTASTVVDLRAYEHEGSWSVVRRGAVGEEELRATLGAQFHFRPDSYLEMMRSELPDYDRLQEELVAVAGDGVGRILELGTGTGQTASRLLAAHPEATLLGIDESAAMLAVARDTLPPGRVELVEARLEDELPDGPFDLVASALCVHHLDAAGKADLFRRVHAVIAPEGRFVLADVIEPEDPSEASTPLTPGFDKPSPVPDQLEWLEQAGFSARLAWASGDLAVIVGSTSSL